MKSIAIVFLSVLFAGANLRVYGAPNEVCFGQVAGVGDLYNPATGSGFLALRAGPKSLATQVGELFEGDRVIILTRSGEWLNVMTGRQGQGWVFAKYIRSSCK